MGWVVQVMSDQPDLDDAPSFAYFHVAIADPKKAVQAVAKQTGTNQRHVRHVMALSPELIRAVSHPLTTILGHPTGRQLLRRPGYDVDLEAVLRACGKHGVAVEINANPHRLET